jgi:hypothetical protein
VAFACLVELSYIKLLKEDTAMSGDIVERMRNDRKLRWTHSITPEELKFLETVQMFGQVKSVTDLLFILKNIRDGRPPTL